MSDTWKPRRASDLLLKDMAAFMRELCQHHERYVAASGKPLSATSEKDYLRALALLERMQGL